MTKFDKVISELATLPSIDPTIATNKLSPAFKSLPKNISDVVAGVGGALSDATQKNPEDAMLIDKLKDEKANWTTQDIAKLEKFLTSRGLQFSNQQQQQQTSKEQSQTTPEENQNENENETPSIKSSTTYGGNLQGV